MGLVYGNDWFVLSLHAAGEHTLRGAGAGRHGRVRRADLFIHPGRPTKATAPNAGACSTSATRETWASYNRQFFLPATVLARRWRARRWSACSSSATSWRTWSGPSRRLPPGRHRPSASTATTRRTATLASSRHRSPTRQPRSATCSAPLFRKKPASRSSPTARRQRSGHRLPAGRDAAARRAATWVAGERRPADRAAAALLHRRSRDPVRRHDRAPHLPTHPLVRWPHSCGLAAIARMAAGREAATCDSIRSNPLLPDVGGCSPFAIRCSLFAIRGSLIAVAIRNSQSHREYRMANSEKRTANRV